LLGSTDGSSRLALPATRGPPSLVGWSSLDGRRLVIANRRCAPAGQQATASIEGGAEGIVLAHCEHDLPAALTDAVGTDGRPLERERSECLGRGGSGAALVSVHSTIHFADCLKVAFKAV